VAESSRWSSQARKVFSIDPSISGASPPWNSGNVAQRVFVSLLVHNRRIAYGCTRHYADEERGKKGIFRKLKRHHPKRAEMSPSRDPTDSRI